MTAKVAECYNVIIIYDGFLFAAFHLQYVSTREEGQDVVFVVAAV